MIRLPTLAVAALACLAAGPQAASAAPRDGFGYGIADPVYGQALPKTQVARLAPRAYRVQVPYDVMTCTSRPQTAAELKRRLIEVRRLGVKQVLATFSMSCQDMFPPGSTEPPNKLPLDDEYDAGISSAIAEFDDLVDAWSPVNEPNYARGWFGDSIDSGGPARAARYFKILQSKLPAGDDLVSPEFISTADRTTGKLKTASNGEPLQRVFIRRYLEAMSSDRMSDPWGDHAAFHPYDAVTGLNDASISDFESMVQGADVWLTEIGGLVPSEHHPAAADQGAQVEWLANKVATDPRIGRAYYYNPYEVSGGSWDSSLLNDDGTPRPAWITWCLMANPYADCAPGAGDSVELSGRRKGLAQAGWLLNDL